jgi:hypothetical protein
MTALQQRQLWIGMVEVRALKPITDLLDDAKGAFVHVVTWACSANEFRSKAEKMIEQFEAVAFVEVSDAEPVEARRARVGGELKETIEEMILRAESDPEAIIHGTFHVYAKDDA